MFFSKTVIIGKRALQARHQLGVSGNFRLPAIGRVFDEINVRLIRPARSQAPNEDKRKTTFSEERVGLVIPDWLTPCGLTAKKSCHDVLE